MLENCFDHDNDYRHEEHKNGGPVDPMHVPHVLRIRRIRIPLFDVEVFLDLSPDSHTPNLIGCPKINNTPEF
jgi:hypothetical protein